MSSAPNTPPVAPPTDNAVDDSFVLTLPDDPASNKDWYLWAGVLALLVFVAFIPAVAGSYLWDDDHHAGLIQFQSTLNGLKNMWIPGQATPQYYPLTFTTFWIEYYFWQNNTLGYHIDNMIFHAASAVLVWRLLRRLRLPGAWLAAAIWAVHPLQTESVAWISERKNVLSGLLFFASIWFYVEFDEWPEAGKKSVLGNKQVPYALSLLCFALALLAKTVACAMPAVILVLAWWRGRKLLNPKTLLPILPFFLFGILFGAMTVYLETSHVGAAGSDWNLSPIDRLLIASRGVWFYVCKLVFPLKLTFSYPRVLPSPLHWLYLLGAIGVAALFWIKRQDWGRGPLAAVLYYVVTLFPSLGFINIYPMRYSFVADHFQYLAGLGLIVLFVAAGAELVKKLRLSVGITATLSIAIAIALFCPAWMQAHAYASPELLWRDVLAKNPNSWMADDNLGVELIKLGEQDEALANSDRAQNQPDAAAADDANAKSNFAEAEQLLRNALALRPQNYLTHNALGLLYRHENHWPEAEAELKLAVDAEDRDIKEDKVHGQIAPYVNYAQVFQHNHPDADVREWLDRALSLSKVPDIKPTDIAMARLAYGDYWINQSLAAAKNNKLDAERADLVQARDHLTAALAAKPDDLAGLFDLGQAYERLGLLDQQNADAERAAGHLQNAAQAEYLSHQVDDESAMKNYYSATLQVQNGRFAPALAGMGKLYRRDTLVRDTQADAVSDLLRAFAFFRDALNIDPNVPDAAHYIPDIANQLMEQAQEARAHESTWEPLRQKLQILADGNVTKQTVADAEQAIHAALWPARAAHPLRGPLTNLRVAIGGYQSDVPPPNAAKTVTDTAKAALAAWHLRKPEDDALSDVEAAATCYQGVLEADGRSAVAWRNLQELTDALSAVLAAHPERADVREAIRVARSELDQHRAATQPVPRKVDGPVPSKVDGPTSAPATAPSAEK